jgi:hypothetical protein
MFCDKPSLASAAVIMCLLNLQQTACMIMFEGRWASAAPVVAMDCVFNGMFLQATDQPQH